MPNLVERLERLMPNRFKKDSGGEKTPILSPKSAAEVSFKIMIEKYNWSERIAGTKRYCEQYYKLENTNLFTANMFLTRYLLLGWIDPNDPNFIKERHCQELREKLKEKFGIEMSRVAGAESDFVACLGELILGFKEEPAPKE